MKLQLRYDETLQTIDLDDQAMQQLWVSLALEDDETLTDEDRKQKLQNEVDIQLNRPEYNNWHKFDRHRGFSKTQPGKDDSEETVDVNEPLMEEVADDRVFYKDELDREERTEYEVICAWVRDVLYKKPEWAEAFIAVRMDDEPIRAFAARIGADENNITQKLKRAEKRLAAAYKEHKPF